jgi:aspartate carbamoyltransferase catalytic subunit
VANGVAVRMAVLFMLLGPGRHLSQLSEEAP